MLYSIMSQDVAYSLPARTKVRKLHLARLKDLLKQKRLILAGPHPILNPEHPDEAGFSGSLIVAEFPSLEEAEAWARADPYVAIGVSASVQVKPFKQILP